MLIHNSSNNKIYLECLLSTRVCVCVCGMQSHVCPVSLPSFRTKHVGLHVRRPPQAPDMHQYTMDNASQIVSSLRAVRCLSAPRTARLSHASSLQNHILPTETKRTCGCALCVLPPPACTPLYNQNPHFIIRIPTSQYPQAFPESLLCNRLRTLLNKCTN